MKAGLEIHQQLATGKLFCDCPSELSEVVLGKLHRRLRATGGENQAIDPAALFQAARGLTYRYETTPSNCLVELDEEPPHALNPEAVDLALEIALLLHARPIDEIIVMRKIVVDGSNTSGFQRTALVAVDGSLEVGGRRYSIPSICLEEDAARKIGESAGETTYRLDRLGIPLIEVATGPDIRSGPEAREVAEELGGLLRATGKVRRGIGTIREDLNVSIEGGARAEIKGVQELRLIQRYVEGEEERQRTLLAARDRLLAQGARVPDAAPLDVSEMLRAVATGPISQTLKKGGVVFGTALPGFAGSLRPDPEAPERLGRELADYARATGVRGLLHSDELPAQGVEGPVVEEIRRKLHADGPSDAFVLLAAPDPGAALRGIEAVRNRARAALEGVPRETRDPLPDGRSRYSRPLPGRDRMYPETDVPPLAILSDRLARLGAVLPEAPDRVRARLVATYAISPDVARQIQRWGETGRFEALIGRGRAVASVARLLTQELSALESSEGPEAVERISLDTLDALLLAVEGGEFSKEGIPTVLVELSKGAPSLREAAGRAGLSGISAETLAQLADAVVERNLAMVEDRGEAAFRPLMGDLMREVRGRRDGQEVAEALRAALARHRRKAPE